MQKPVVSVIRKGTQPVYPNPGSIVTVKVGLGGSETAVSLLIGGLTLVANYVF